MMENMDLELEELKELLEARQYLKLRERIEDANDADVAALFSSLQEEEMLKAFRILPKGRAADVFAYLDVDEQQFIITSMSEKDAALIIDNLMSDDAADLLEEMPANIVKKLLAAAKPDTRRDINHLLQYPEDSAGSIMTVEYVDLMSSQTVASAIDRIRKKGLDSETINICYVLDPGRKLLGTVALRYLLLSKPDDIIGDFMHENVVSVNTHTDQEEVARQFQKYDFIAMPVVDNENRMVGIVTVDDIVDILQEEATEDIEKMAAITPTDKPYMKTNTFETYKKRMPWLLLLMISATFTGRIIASFESALSACVILTAYIPMLMDTGGNAGSQTSITVIRGLSLGEIDFKDVFAIIWKEFRVAFLCGMTLAVCNMAKLLLFDGVGMLVAGVVCLSLLVTVVVAKFVGSVLPLAAAKVGLDPTVMASPFITTIVDALSLVTYFRFASIMMGL